MPKRGWEEGAGAGRAAPGQRDTTETGRSRPPARPAQRRAATSPQKRRRPCPVPAARLGSARTGSPRAQGGARTYRRRRRQLPPVPRRVPRAPRLTHALPRPRARAATCPPRPYRDSARSRERTRMASRPDSAPSRLHLREVRLRGSGRRLAQPRLRCRSRPRRLPTAAFRRRGAEARKLRPLVALLPSNGFPQQLRGQQCAGPAPAAAAA